MFFIESATEILANRIISDAIRNQATDIHIIPRRTDTLIQFRFTNKLIPHLSLPKEECDRLISHFKFTANMDIGERRRPQNGAIISEMNGEMLGLRLSTLPSNSRESLVIRLLLGGIATCQTACNIRVDALSSKGTDEKTKSDFSYSFKI